MKKYMLFSFVAAFSVVAHILFAGRHEFHLFADSLQWAVWFYMLFYAFDFYMFGRHIITHAPIVASAAFLVLHHLAMFIGPLAENAVAALFILAVMVFGLKRFWEVLGDEN